MLLDLDYYSSSQYCSLVKQVDITPEMKGNDSIVLLYARYYFPIMNNLVSGAICLENQFFFTKRIYLGHSKISNDKRN